MPAAPLPANEVERIKTLRSYAILDSEQDPAFDAITDYVAKQFEADVAFISFIDTDRQWFKSGYGLDTNETPRDEAFCAHTILDTGVTYIPDATLDPRVKDNPFVIGAPHIRFYCGAPLVAPEGQIVGSLCIIDTQPRPDFSNADQRLLRDMAGIVMQQLEMRKAAGIVADEIETRIDAEANALQAVSRLAAFVEHVPVAIALIARDGQYQSRSHRFVELQDDLFPPDVRDNFIQSISVRDDWAAAFDAVLTGHTMSRMDDVLIMQDGRSEYAKWEMMPWYGADGSIDGAVLSITEVTAQVTARMESQRRSELLNAVLENVDNGIVSCDAEGHLTLFNKKTRQMHGIEMIDLPPEDCSEYYSLFEADGVTPLSPDRVPLYQALGGRQVVDQSMVIAPDHLPRRDIVAQAAPLRRKDGTIIGAVASMADVTESRAATRNLKASEAQAVHVAFHDSLTGLANRAKLNAVYGDDHIINPDERVAALFVDLNRFKQINDTLGHQVGDDLLVRVSTILKTVLGDDAFIARIGGDEFVAIINVVEKDQALRFGQTIIDWLGSPIAISGHMVVTGAAIGIALAPDHGTTVTDLVRRADIAMYRSKSESVSEPVLFEPVFELNTVERARLEGELTQSIDRGELRVLYQPIVCGTTYDIKGAEALVRWNHPRLGAIGPDKFIPIAEECGFIYDLGLWVLEEAVSHFADHPDMFVSVNVSPVQFRDPLITEKVSAILKKAEFKPENLELEITESLLINDANVARLVIDQLKAEGIRIALDDFGTGYSSLSYIHEFPFNKVKIDRSFITQLGKSAQSEAVVRCVVKLASELGMVVTAEGVESEQHQAELQLIGCHTLQGYKYGRPMTFDDISAALDTPGQSATIALLPTG